MQEKYCSDEHRFKADGNARKAVERVGKLLSRREFLGESLGTICAAALHLDSQPYSPGARREYVANKLHGVDLLLWRKGPHHADVRSFARVEADAMRLMFETAPSLESDDRENYVRTLSILRDVGPEDPEDRISLHYAWEIVRFYHARRDYLNLAKALQALANTYRLYGDERNGRRYTRYAWNILREQFMRSTEHEVLTLVHQSAFWDLRLNVENIERWEAKDKVSRIKDLAGRVNTPTIWLETYRELAGHYGREGETKEQSEEAIQQMERIRKEHPNLTTYSAPTELRPPIELLLSSGEENDSEQAKHLIQTKYLELYLKDPHLHYFRQLKKWRRTFSLSFELPKPTYASPILVYLPRGVPVA